MWVLYRLPTGETVEVWPIDDQNNVPDNMSTDLGRVLVRNFPGRHPETGEPVMQTFVVDDVPDHWEAIGELPPEFVANPPVPAKADPRADLWALDLERLQVMAAELGIYEPEVRPGAPRWLKVNWIHAIHDARTRQHALASSKEE